MAVGEGRQRPSHCGVGMSVDCSPVCFAANCFDSGHSVVTQLSASMPGWRAYDQTVCRKIPIMRITLQLASGFPSLRISSLQASTALSCFSSGWVLAAGRRVITYHCSAVFLSMSPRLGLLKPLAHPSLRSRLAFVFHAHAFFSTDSSAEKSSSLGRM